jgi:flagellar biosynthesis protein FlhB
MSVDVNMWAVLLAAVSSMVVGSLWYLPATFGNTWQRLAKVKMVDRSKMTPGSMVWVYGSVFVASLVTAYVLALVTGLYNNFFNDSFMSDDTFEMRRKKLTLLNAAHELVTILVMALIIGWLKP